MGEGAYRFGGESKSETFTQTDINVGEIVIQIY